MPEVRLQLSDHLYDHAKRRAAEAGHESLADYLVEVLTDDAPSEEESFDYLFTLERLAEIDAIRAAVAAGERTYSSEEVWEELARRREGSQADERG